MENLKWTVNIMDLVNATIEAEKVSKEQGYISFLQPEMSKKAQKAIFLNAGSSKNDLERAHIATRLVGEQGIYILSDVSVAGHSFIFSEDRLIVDGSVPSKVSEAFAIQDGLEKGAFKIKSTVFTDKPLLVIAGPGYPIWGHWLLDFLPRLALAQSILGCKLHNHCIPIPSDTPSWVFKMVEFFCGLDVSRFILFDREKQEVKTSDKCYVPTFAHTDYFLHSFIHEFYRLFIPTVSMELPSKICISRSKFKESRSVARIFSGQKIFEQKAQSHGYTIVHPENHSFRDQINIFANAKSVIGEFGSGMHNTIFSRPGTKVGQFVYPNDIQSRIAALCQHSSVFLLPDNQPRFDQPVVAEMEISQAEIDNFFTVMEEK